MDPKPRQQPSSPHQDVSSLASLSVASGIVARADAARLIADRHAEAFGPGHVGKRCVACTAMHNLRLVEITWSKTFESIPKAMLFAILHLLTHVGISGANLVVAYNSYHAICGDCLADLRRQRIIGGVITAVGTLLAVTGAGVALGSAISILGGSEQWRWWLAVAAGAVLLGGLGSLACARRRSLCIPEWLRAAGPAPFLLGALRVVADTVKDPVRTTAIEQARLQRAIELAIAERNLYHLGRVLGSLPAAIGHYARYSESRYSAACVEPLCCHCGTAEDLKPAIAWWRAPADGQRTGHSSVIEFRTHHMMCARCSSGRLDRKLGALGLLCVQLMLAVPGVLVALSAAIAAVMATRREECGWAIAIAICGAAALALAFWIERPRKRLRIPHRIVSIECKPWRFVQIRRDV